MDVYEVRRRNIIWLLERSSASHPRATDKDFAVAHDINPKHLSQIKNRSKGKREVGAALARRIENSLQVARGWLDSPQWSAKSLATPRGIAVPRLADARASMGSGSLPPEHEEVVERIEINEKWLRSQFRILTGVENITFIVGWGDSMSPTYRHGDILFVDVGVKEVSVDAVYAYSLRGELYIKRLQRVPGEGTLKVISDNKSYETYLLEARARKEVRVHGRVVGSLNWNRL